MQDFEPYFCTWEACTTPFDVPNTFDGLLSHLQDHVEERYHVDTPDGEHKELNEDEFEKHVAQHGQVTKGMLNTMAEASRRKAAFLFESCPFCGGYPDVVEKRFRDRDTPEAQGELRRHIKQHMQDVALFLPPYREDILDEDDNLKSSAVTRRRSAGQSNIGEPSDSNTVCDKEDCDCKDKAKSSDDGLWADSTPQSNETDEKVWAKMFPDSPRYETAPVPDEYYRNDEVLRPFVARWTREPLKRNRDESQAHLIVKWVSSIDYKLKQDELIRQRRPGTGQWLFESQDYTFWLHNPGQTLFCQGLARAGKTFLTSIVIDHLNLHFGQDGAAGLAYIFFDLRRPESGPEIFANLLVQLAQQVTGYRANEVLGATMKKLHQRSLGRTPTFDETSECLQTVMALFSRVFLVIDALDECVSGDRAVFLSQLKRFQDGAWQPNIFVTSRVIPDMDETEVLKNVNLLTVPVEGEHVMAEIMLSEGIDEEGGFRRRIDASSSFQRETITDRRGVVDIRCVAKDVIHGYFKDGIDPASLIVYEFQFDSHKRARRIAKVDIQFVYEGDEIGRELEVFKIEPEGRWTLEPRGQTDGRANTRETQQGATVQGSTQVVNYSYGYPNAARWTLMENTSTKAGVPTIFRAVVLLKREDDGHFHSSVKVEASVDWKNRFSQLFGTTPADDRILYDPSLPSTNKLRIYDRYNLGDVDLHDLIMRTSQT